MKREIKFRAIDFFSGDFIYGQAFFIDADNNQGYISDGIDRHILVKKETVGQFTGLKDKNGKEIYEGDVLKITAEEPYSNNQFNTDYDWELTGKVIEEDFMWVLKLPDKHIIPFFDIVNNDINIDLIGNIYENPGLS